jgi:3-methyladenine DNA glycosylase/8-oxoguanine DNA glycosylase
VLSRDVATIVERVRWLFDLKADPAEITGHLGNDPMLAAVLERFSGLRVPGAWDPFETSVRAILGQQVSVKAATTVSGRIVAAYGEPLEDDNDGRRFLFPSAECLSRARFNKIGITESRARAIRALAGAIHKGSLVFDGAIGLEKAVDRLLELQGIGPWTAHYIAMRAFGEPDAFPSGDLALRRAAMAYEPGLTTEAALIDRAEAWRPWRAYATMYLWADYTERQSREMEVRNQERAKG